MNFDAFAVAAIAAEFRSVILGGRVQRVTQINSLTYGFEIFVHPTAFAPHPGQSSPRGWARHSPDAGLTQISARRPA